MIINLLHFMKHKQEKYIENHKEAKGLNRSSRSRMDDWKVREKEQLTKIST